MFCYMKISKLKLSSHDRDAVAGFTMIELLVSIAVMGITASLVSYGIGTMISSNQNLAKEQNRRVEASRALDMITADVKLSRIQSARTLPSGVSGTLVLDMDLVTGTICTDATKNRIIYTIQASGSDEIGPNVVYRYGLISGSDGTIDCTGGTPVNTPIADAITITNSISNIIAPTCNSPAVSTPSSPPTGVNGFYSCVSDNQVSVVLFSKLSNTKIYGVNRTINSGYIPDVPTATNDCDVPDLGVGSTPKSPTDANTAISNANLLYNGINLEVSGTQVLSQTPPSGTKIACNKGLVTYTY
jgi:prepilin-type N-terminal cleavage/methylation domain-containing protein